MPNQCRRCGRALKNPKYQLLGIGPICIRKNRILSESIANDLEQIVDLPFDPVTMDIVCERRMEPSRFGPVGILHFNIPQTIVKHSPTGMEWGYGGSGPADFALNILNIFMPHKKIIKCGNAKVNPYVSALYQDFKSTFVATLPKAGGTISGDAIRQYLTDNAKSVVDGYRG